MAGEALPMQTEDGKLSGRIKSWNGLKGYGFITCDEVDGDVMFSRTELPADAREVSDKILTGREVKFDGIQNPDGRAKASVVLLPPVEGYPLPGMIKSYSDRNGYGFVTSSSLTEDVRFERDNLPPIPPGVQIKGELVTFNWTQLADGKLRVTSMTFQGAGGATGVPGMGGFGPRGGKGYAGKGAFDAQAALNQIAAQLARVGKGGAAAAVAGSLAGLGVRVAPLQRPAAHVPAYSGKGMSEGVKTGHVKSFSEKNGYGFITCADVAGDYKFGRVDLADGVPVQPGAVVDFQPVITPDGRVQAKQVRLSQGGADRRPTPSQAWGVPAATAMAEAPPAKRLRPTIPAPSQQQQQQWASAGEGAGMIKSFNAGKGLGFITCDGVDGDVAFFSKDLDEQVVAQVTPGAMVSFDMVQLPDGKLRAQGLRLAG